MVFILLMFCWGIYVAVAIYEGVKVSRTFCHENVMVCRAAHRPHKPCMMGCEHSVPHICKSNECLEHKAAECVPAYLYGYKTPIKDYPLADDSIPPTTEQGKEER